MTSCNQKRSYLLFPVLVMVFALNESSSAPVEAMEPGGVELFEKEIRPLLVEKCQACHNAKKLKGGLQLLDRELLLKGGESGPAIVPGKPDESLLIRAVGYLDDPKMPPDKKLADADIAKLRRWVAMGAPWPASQPANATAKGHGFQISAAQRKWWAFQPVRDRVPPAVKRLDWPRNGIDNFILAELEARGMQPAVPAEPRTWIRRVTLDLTGLPPAPEDVSAFLADKSPGARARVVDRLLALPVHGQRWARHWLDIVRYADYHDGDPKPRTASCEPLEAWRYRDWVVASINRDLPFDQFIIHQIAGDMLADPGGREFYADGLIASTFLSNGSWDRGDADKEKMVSDMVDDQVDTIGKAFMGLTFGCARCHDHKFDPISQADYYALAGMLYSTHILKDQGTKGGEYTLNRVPLAPKSYVVKRDRQVQQIAALNSEITKIDKKTPRSAADEARRSTLIKERDTLQRELLPEPAYAEAAQEGGTAGGLFPKIQDVPIHLRGSYTKLGPIVPRRLPELFAGQKRPLATKESGRRELANWVASKYNPLTARVIVNRVWQGHFGGALARTPNNFGMASEPPSHPALLDWLACRFIEDGWSLKKLHKRIVLSATYQQRSRVGHDQIARDPDNRWLGRFAARRLEAETIRDVLLVAAGRLDPALGGPASADLNIRRRSLYVQTARFDRNTFAMLFDAANPDASEEKRGVSTVAPQALFLLNHDFALARAGELANRLECESRADETARIQRAYQLLFARPASAAEIQIAREFLQSGKSGASLAWRDLAHVLLCCNELVYLD